ncbi:MAG TPA: hypothetical protein VLX59_17000, partial [Acidimicrobiales bacterium]|nr:hypothetical protein [Acidimicrobiales bacterium]
MSAFDLTAEIAQQPRGVTIQLDYGEFRGPWVLDRPVRLQGRGPATVLWSPHGPVLTVESSDVHLADLAIETTEEVDGLALLVEAGAHPVGFSKVRIGGRAEGLHPGRRWWVPAVIELGRIQPTQRIERTVICDIPEPASIRVELDGLQVTATEQAGGRLALRLVLDTGGLSAGSAIEGQVHVEAGGLSGIIRVAGSTMVDAGAGAAPVPLLQRLSRDHAPARDATLTGLPWSVVTPGPAVTP